MREQADHVGKRSERTAVRPPGRIGRLICTKPLNTPPRESTHELTRCAIGQGCPARTHGPSGTSRQRSGSLIRSTPAANTTP